MLRTTGQQWACCAEPAGEVQLAAVLGGNLLLARESTFADEVSPELRLVLLCSHIATRDANARDINQLITQQLDWMLFTRLVLRHRVCPVVYRYLRLAAYREIPDEVLAILAQATKDNLYRSLQMITALQRLLRSLTEQGIRAIVIKGVPLAQQLYGDATLRMSKDLDILVQPEELDQARKIIERHGYVCKQKLDCVQPHTIKKWLASNKHLEYWQPELKICVELHWRLACRDMEMPLQQVKAMTRTVLLWGQSVNILGKEALLLYLAIHGAAHAWFRAKWLLDIDLIIRKENISWGGLYIMAVKLELVPVLNQALILAKELLAVPLPREITAILIRDRKSRQLAYLALQLLADQDNAPHIDKSAVTRLRLLYRQTIYEFRLSGSRKPVAFISAWFSPAAEDVALFSLPERFYFVYYAIKPFTWLYRSIRNRMPGLFRRCNNRLSGKMEEMS